MVIFPSPKLAMAQVKCSKTLSIVYHEGMLVVWVVKGSVGIGPWSSISDIDHHTFFHSGRLDAALEKAGGCGWDGHSHALMLTW